MYRIIARVLPAGTPAMLLAGGAFSVSLGSSRNPADFRRTDNGNALYNPFVGSYILDAFTTEIGAEVYLKASDIIAMGAVTGGEMRGTVLNPGKRGPALLGNGAMRGRLSSRFERRLPLDPVGSSVWLNGPAARPRQPTPASDAHGRTRRCRET